MANPWIHHINGSATSLGLLGLEKVVAPGQTIAPSVNDYLTRDLPPVPNSSGQGNPDRPLSCQPPGGFDPNDRGTFYSHNINRFDGISTPLIGSKSHSLPESVYELTHSPSRRPSGENSKKILPPPPRPPMSKSAQKILQLTGFDPSFDEGPMSHYSISSESSESSGSQYSQPESEPYEHGDIHPSHRAAISTKGESSAACLQSPIYSANERSASISDLPFAAVAAASGSPKSLRVRDRPAKECQKGLDVDGEYSTDILTNEQLMAVEMARYARQKRTRFNDGFDQDIGSPYRDELTGTYEKELVPDPLAVRPRLKFDSENSKVERQYTNARSSTGHPYDGIPVYSRVSVLPAQRPKFERMFGTGESPMKSQFPFNTWKGSDAGESEQGLRRKFSWAMKRLSGGRISPIKQKIFNSIEWEAEGPTSPNSGFKSFLPSQDMLAKGNEQLQDAVTKARKSLRIKTADEKRREDFKKRIVVVGVTDQSPDGKLSEWL